MLYLSDMARLQAFAVALLVTAGAHGQSSVWDLERCLGHAMEHALAVQDALLTAERAETGVLQARGAFLPNLNGSASHGYNVGQSIDPFTNQFASTRIRSNSFGLSTGVVLFNGFQNHLNLRRARLGIDLAQATADQVRNEIALTVASTYLNAVFQHELVRLAALNTAATQRQLDRISRLVATGAAAEGDLAEVRSRLAADKASEVAALNGKALAELALVQLLQLDANAARDFTLAIPREESLRPTPCRLRPTPRSHTPCPPFPKPAARTSRGKTPATRATWPGRSSCRSSLRATAWARAIPVPSKPAWALPKS